MKIPDDNNGSCWRLCFAALLEIRVAAVPSYGETESDPDWYSKYCDWLRTEFGLHLHWFPFCSCDKCSPPPGYSMLILHSRNGDWKHAVVCENGKVVYDPASYDPPIRDEEKLGWAVFHVPDFAKLKEAVCRTSRPTTANRR